MKANYGNSESSLPILFLFCICSVFLLSACSKDSPDIEKQLDKELVRLSGILEQDLYYWSDKRKIPLEVNGFTITVRSEMNASELESELQRLLKEDLSYVSFYEEAGYMIITSKVHFGKILQRKDINSQLLFQQMIPSFFAGSTLIIPTGEFVLKPRNVNSAPSILEEYGDQLVLIKSDLNSL